MTKALFFPMEKGLVITSLFNKAHPFIRYDIGDIGFR
jgi:phenylacetate-coenzyme A ligase PaaK-like adenylate-forming protein